MTPGKIAVQPVSLIAFLYSTTWFEPLSVVKNTIPVEFIFVTAVITTPAGPQFVARVPKLLTLPWIVPQPVTVALLEMTRPLAKKKFPLAVAR